MAVGKALPPGLAAEGLTLLHVSGIRAALPSLLLLLAWNLTGLLLGYGAFVRYHFGGSEGVASAARPARATRAVETGRSRFVSVDNPLLASIPYEVRAVAAKDLRYLLRSVIGKFNLIMLPVFVVIVALVFGRAVTSSALGLSADNLLLFGLLVYTTLFSNNFVNNAFAWEGDGVRVYFMSPLRAEHLLAGKNLAVWAFNLALLSIVIVAWSVLRGLPDPWTLLTSILLYGAAVLFFTTVGNVVSVVFPVRRDISSITNSPSQVAILISLGSLAMAAVLGTGMLFLAYLIGSAWVRPLLMGVLLAALVVAYRLSLGLAARLLERRKEQLIDVLGAAE
jgi:hypothetical protein